MTPNKDWLHMDTVELEKLQWTQDLPPLQRQQTREVSEGSGWHGVAPPPRTEKQLFFALSFSPVTLRGPIGPTSLISSQR